MSKNVKDPCEGLSLPCAMRESPIEFVEYLFHVPKEIEQKIGLNLLRAGQNLAKPNYSIGPKIIRNYGLHFVLQGQVWIKTDNQETVASAGDGFCIFPNQRYQYRIYAAEQPLEMMWLTLQGQLAAELLLRAGMHPSHVHEKGILNPNVKASVIAIFDMLREGDRVNTLALLGQVFQLFAHIDQIRESERIAVRTEWMTEAKNYIHMHFRENISVVDVARHVGFSRTHFTRKFTEALKKSPNRYIQELRINEAKYMLDASDLKIQEIATSLGYPDPFTFTRAYKNIMGAPPSNHHKK